jgi:hypothetical protein
VDASLGRTFQISSNTSLSLLFVIEALISKMLGKPFPFGRQEIFAVNVNGQQLSLPRTSIGL